MPLYDDAEISNRTTHSLWVATDVTTSQETGKHTENSCKLTKSTEKKVWVFFFPDRFKVFSLFNLIKKLKKTNFTFMVLLILCHKGLFNPVVKHSRKIQWMKLLIIRKTHIGKNA